MIHPAPARHVDFDVASLGPCLAVSGHGGARVGSGPKRGPAEAPSAMVAKNQRTISSMFATTQYINASVNIDAQVKTASSGQSVNVKWGRTNSYIGYPPVILKATALPSSCVHVHSGGQ
jgi:hypothetical protein